jgi:hypothetical protein
MRKHSFLETLKPLLVHTQTLKLKTCYIATLNKRKKPNLAGKILESLLSFGEL